MEILEVSGEALCRLSSVLGQMHVILSEPNLTPDGKILNSCLGSLYHEAKRLQLRFVSQHMERVKEHVLSGTATSATLKPMIDETYNRLRDELSERLIVGIHPTLANLYRQNDPLFGADVEQKFPRMSEDISEAGKCLSLNRATALVFHLMRVMEIGVQEFAIKVGVVPPANKPWMWQQILDSINGKIKTLDQHQPFTKRYAAISANLYNVKLAWRNEVMHPKQTYTLEEGKQVFDSVKAFATDLSGVM